MIKNLLFADSLFANRNDEEIAQIKLSHLLGLSPALIAIFLMVANWTYAIFIESNERVSFANTVTLNSVMQKA